MGLSPDSMWLIPTTVFIAGIIGSPHCASMCGPLVVNFANKKSHLAAYQMGRLLTYAMAGALIGAFGESILGSTKPAWLTSLTLAFMAFLLLLNGIKTFTSATLSVPKHLQWIKMPDSAQRLLQKVWRSLYALPIPRTLFAGLAGAMTIFMPCGHLYTFLIGAVATGSAAKGTLYMAAFWAGSAPLLSFSAGWLRQLLSRKQSGQQKWAGGILILAGLFSVIAFGLRIPVVSALTHQHELQQNSKNESQHEIRCH